MNKNLDKLKATLHTNHPLAAYTSWKIGGPAEYFYQPADLADLATLLKSWQEEPITLLGAATNVLIRDNGIKGLVIYLKNHLDNIQILDNFNLRVEAGTSIAHLVKKGFDLEMVDIASFAGIPGTIGGALKMNAGAYGDHIWNHVQSVETINRLGEIKSREAREFSPAYRHITGLDHDEWFVSAELTFARGQKGEIVKLVRDYLKKRETSQPLHLPSCGSVFRNPPGDYAARLIETCGLKGKKIGGAQISEKHANFIVNLGHAKATDVETLMQEIIIKVEQTTGIKLTPEVQIFGT